MMNTQSNYSIKFSQVLSNVEYKRILQRVETLLKGNDVEHKREKEVSLHISVNKPNYTKEKFSVVGDEAIKSYLHLKEEDLPTSGTITYESRKQIDYLKFEDFGYHVRYEEATSLHPYQFIKMRSLIKPKQLHYSLAKTVKYICFSNSVHSSERYRKATISIESSKRASGSSVSSSQLLQQKEEYTLSITFHKKHRLSVTLPIWLDSEDLCGILSETANHTWDLLYCCIKEYPIALKSSEMRKSILQAYNQLIQSTKEFVSFIGPSVVSFNFGNLRYGPMDIWDEEDPFTVTSKTDGLRYIGLFSKQRLFLLSKGSEVIDFGIKFSSSSIDLLDQTIVDGEWVCNFSEKKSHYLIFDVYFYQGEDVRYLDLKSRIDLLMRYEFQFMPEKNNIYCDVLIRVKKFIFPDKLSHTLRSAVKEILEDMKTMLYGCDGIIFTRNVPLIGSNKWSLITLDTEQEKSGTDLFLNTGKTWTSVIKWKPYTMLTVDFKVVILNPLEEEVAFHTLLSSFDSFDREVVMNNFSSYGTKTSKTRISDKVKLTSLRCNNGDEITSGSIVEVLFVQEENTSSDAYTTTVWEPQRVRSDKQVPNLESVAMENYILSRYPITEADLLDQRKYEVFVDNDPRKYDSVTLYKTENHEKTFIRPMTQLHMRLKRQLIENTLYHQKKHLGHQKLRILDLACGRFGEIQIWTKGTVEESIELFLGIDYSENEISDLHGGANTRLLEQSRRCRKTFDNFLFIQGDCSKHLGSSGFTNCSKYSAVYESLMNKEMDKDFEGEKSIPSFPLFHGIFSKQFHLCTMQFALHYFCSPEDKYRNLHTLAQNISNALVEGGKFFGTCIDGHLMKRDLQQNGELIVKSPDEKIVLSVRHDDNTQSGVFVYIESIGQEIFEFYVDFDIVDSIFEKYSLYASECQICEKVSMHKNVHIEDILNEDTKKLPEIQPFLRFSCLHSMFVYQKQKM